MDCLREMGVADRAYPNIREGKSMFKRIILGAILSCFITSGAAVAQSAATGTVNVTATVTASCTINAAASAGTLATANFSNSGSSLISTTAYTNATLATGDCNTPTHLSLSSANGAATTSAGVTGGGGYANFFNYTAVSTFSTLTTTLDTATNPARAGPESATSSGASSGSANGAIGITITPDGTPKLAAGVYNDVLTVTLTAN